MRAAEKPSKQNKKEQADELEPSVVLDTLPFTALSTDTAQRSDELFPTTV